MPTKSQKLNIEPIEDLEVDKDLQYIQELEAEIEGLNAQVKVITKQLNSKPKEIDIDYKIKYHQLLKTFQTTLEEFLPF